MLLGIDNSEVLDDLELAVARLGDVHVHAHVMLAGHHLCGAAGPLRDRRVIERPNDRIPLERAGLDDRGFKPRYIPVQALPAGNCASPGKRSPYARSSSSLKGSRALR